MFFNPRSEEEAFMVKPQTIQPESLTTQQLNLEEIVDKLNKILQQVNLISMYLSHLSKKFDKTLDMAVAYNKDLDEIEARIETLKSRMNVFEMEEPSVSIERKVGRKAV